MGDWSWLTDNLKPQQFSRADTLFMQGNAIEHMYVVSSGRIKLLRHTSEGNQLVLHIATAAEMIAEASFFSDVYHCSAQVDQPSEIYTIKRDLALREILNNPDQSHSVMQLFARQIRDLRGLIETRNIRSAHDRILAYLSNTADENGRAVLEFSLRDMAYKLGLAHETVYRELRKMEKNGTLTRPGPGVFFLNG